MAQPTPFDTMRQMVTGCLVTQLGLTPVSDPLRRAGLRLSRVVPTGAEPVVLEAVLE
jgi:hypothetical protein